ncbi:MAG: hypothetical protein KC419_00050 [Anaerolineales bacterium]|nr:hypothetical protein [Anaerolineales bacterium]MCA9926824.1 hypothetical protein [Anaerolineales bacterium]
MSTSRRLFVVTTLLLLALLVGVTTASAAMKCNVQGLVFVDTNENGVWDVGEAGYGGELIWDEDQEVMRYAGTEVTIITPAYDEFELETAGYRELEEDETDPCCHQDYVIDGEINAAPQRPCSGTFGLPSVVDDVRLEIWVTAPAGYRLTSPNPQYVTTGPDMVPVDFGIAPVGDAIGGPIVPEAVVLPEPVMVPLPYVVEGTGFVPGLVFVDSNENGVWEYGEAGFGGATITLISPAYDEFELLSAGYRDLDEDETVACSQQDTANDGEINPMQVRPCAGTWGLTHAGDDIRWEVWLTVPAGYTVTSPNPQYFTTGETTMPVDFGIAPVE